MMNFKRLLLHVNTCPFIDQARFGIEWEGRRVGLAGNLAKTDHPAIFGDRSCHPYIQTNFGETQTEMIILVAGSIPRLFQYLAVVYGATARSIPKEEMIRPLGMPPTLPEKDREIIITKLRNFEDILCRHYLAKGYRK